MPFRKSKILYQISFFPFSLLAEDIKYPSFFTCFLLKGRRRKVENLWWFSDKRIVGAYVETIWTYPWLHSLLCYYWSPGGCSTEAAVSLQDRNETAMGLLARCISPLEEDYYCSLSLAIEALYFAVGTAEQTDKWFTHMNAAHPIKETHKVWSSLKMSHFLWMITIMKKRLWWPLQDSRRRVQRDFLPYFQTQAKDWSDEKIIYKYESSLQIVQSLADIFHNQSPSAFFSPPKKWKNGAFHTSHSNLDE